MTDKQKLKEAIRLLKIVKQDAKLALSGRWNRGDDGFTAQIQLIESFFDKIESPPPETKFKQGKLPL